MCETKTDTNKLVEDNMKLVYGIIGKEYPTFSRDEDVIQCGMLGLCKAAHSLDSSKSRFSTYAYKCIRNEIQQEFRRRRPHNSNVSLESKTIDGGTLADVLLRDDDVSYLEYEDFEELLTPKEREILQFCEVGYTKNEIADMMGYKPEKVRRIVRNLRSKWRDFCEDSR